MEGLQQASSPLSGSKPAPGALAFVQAFADTVDYEPGREALGNPEQLRGWLVDHGLLAANAQVTGADFRRAIELREALRGLVVGNTQAEPEPGAVETLNRVASRARLFVRFQPDGRSQMEPAAPGVDGAIGRLLAIVFAAMVDGSWSRLKVCRNDACRWVFYDASKNRSGAWCTMADCGNDAKVRSYRQRQRTG
jgi:predicted RNA-binding Zn ribbon-like protein